MTRIKPRSAIYIAAVLAVLALLVTGVYAAIVDPERIPQIGGNVDPCPAATTWLKAETGELSAGFVSDDNVHITFDNVYAAVPESADQQSALDWTLNTVGFTVLFVLVMDGEDGGNTYDYQPEGVRTDDFLTTPGPLQGEFTFKNISHVDFCYAEAEAEEGKLQPLTAAKTAAGSFGQMITWDLTKTAAPTSHSGSIGDTFASTWTVVATKTETPGDHVVEGEITITNPNHIEVPIEIDDVLDDDTLTVATVTCPDTGKNSGTVPANGELVCSYTALPEDDSATVNTAEVTSLADGVEGVTVMSGIMWTENPIGDEETRLEDARFAFSKPITETTTETFSEQFNCSAEGTFTHDNTATLTGSETNLTASASVTVDCDDIQRPSLGVEQVTVATAANGGDMVTGSFVIKNHSGGSITRVTLGQVTLSFVSRGPGGITVNHTATCTHQANGYELEPHEAKQFSYECTISPAVPSDATELTARVTVGTATNQIGEVREKPFSATSPSFKFDGGGR